MRSLHLGTGLAVADLLWSGTLRPASAQVPPGTTATADGRLRMIAGSCARPQYPISSLKAGETGISSITVLVSAIGDVTSTTVVRSSGHPALDEAAAFGLKACKFEAAKDRFGQGVISSTVVDYRWRLEDASPDPWIGLRTRQNVPYEAINDVASTPFSGSSAATPTQQFTMLSRLQEQATQNASCTSIERVLVLPLPPNPERPPQADKLDDVHFADEQWTLTECGFDMQYAVHMNLRDGALSTYMMTPLAPASQSVALNPRALPLLNYAQRVRLAIKPQIIWPMSYLPEATCEVEALMDPQGLIVSHRVIRSQGDKAWCPVVLKALDKTARLPTDTDGRVPNKMIITFRSRD